MIDITQDESMWAVYSSQFDYMAYGKTKEEALNNFEVGLYATIEERVKAGLDPLLRIEPQKRTLM